MKCFPYGLKYYEKHKALHLEEVQSAATLCCYVQYRKTYFALRASRDYIPDFPATLRGISVF